MKKKRIRGFFSFEYEELLDLGERRARSGTYTASWMDQNYDWSSATFTNRSWESVNLATNKITDTLSTLSDAYTPPKTQTTITCTVSKTTAKENEQVTVSGTISADVSTVVTIQKSVDTSWATQETTTATHGAYSMTISRTEGSYTIRATWPGNTTHEPATNPQTTLNITPRTGTLKITILDDKNNSITGATITTTETPTGQAALQGNSATDGTATFTDTRIGEYTINASKTGYKTNIDTAEVNEDQTTSKTIKLIHNGIPGFPVEAIALGVVLYLGYSILFRINKIKKYHLKNN